MRTFGALDRSLIYKFGNLQYFLNHFFLALLVVGVHGILKAGIQVPFHQLLVGGLEESDYRKVLLHDVDAVFAVLDHLDDLVDMATGFLKSDLGFLLIFVHK